MVTSCAAAVAAFPSDKRFTTYERAEIRLPQVVKKNGSRVDYDREKLAASFWLALRKRPATTEAVEGAITRIEEKLLALGEREIRPRRWVRWSCARRSSTRWPTSASRRSIAISRTSTISPK